MVRTRVQVEDMGKIRIRRLRWWAKVRRTIDLLDLRANIQYLIAGQRYRRIRERFMDFYSETIGEGLIEKASNIILAFQALRKEDITHV